MSNSINAKEVLSITLESHNYKLTYGEIIRSHPFLIMHQVLHFSGSLITGTYLDPKKMFDNLKKLFINKINDEYSQDSLFLSSMIQLL